MPPGGKRLNAGRKQGFKFPSTLQKEAVREATRTYINAVIPAMLRSQVANAIGIGHLYTRDKSGKFTKIENPASIDQLLSEGVEGEHYWIFAKDPSVQAFTDLMNRALDKPAEQLKVTGADDGPIEHVFSWRK